MSSRRISLKGKIGALLLVILLLGVYSMNVAGKRVPHKEKWGIYALDLATEDVTLIYSTPEKISGIQINNIGDKFVFS